MSVCQPMALVPPNATPFGLTQDATYLYWTDDTSNAIERTNKTSGATDVLNRGTTFDPTSIAVDDTHLYWGDATGVWTCDKTQCLLNPPILVANEEHALVLSLAIDDTHVYWSEGFGFVLTAPKSGTNLTAAPLWTATSGTSAHKVAADGQRVYFTASDGVLRAVALDAGAAVSVSTGNSSGSFGIAVDSANVYWGVAGPSHGLINVTPTASLSPTAGIVSGPNAPRVIATDGTNVYWASSAADAGAGDSIMGCTIASCTPMTLGSGYSVVEAIVADEKAVYFTDYGTNNGNDGAVWKVAK
jgi:hypothetical protein